MNSSLWVQIPQEFRFLLFIDSMNFLVQNRKNPNISSYCPRVSIWKLVTIVLFGKLLTPQLQFLLTKFLAIFHWLCLSFLVLKCSFPFAMSSLFWLEIICLWPRTYVLWNKMTGYIVLDQASLVATLLTHKLCYVITNCEGILLNLWATSFPFRSCFFDFWLESSWIHLISEYNVNSVTLSVDRVTLHEKWEICR